ncbi:sugar phosphate isomerase/epimerase family protein [Paraflavitalea pollutisoli]|uniref:sugar phosphate isomerase/epimerase family protein n=1 Tax=Paraflavitalea pollutisoli TaxID=3034143 RepID=UPI0023EC22C5|nr:TIM barrel protein [Paraflavitalea sp. H1-2-19X]
MPLTRRKFFGLGASATTAMLLSSLDSMALDKPAFSSRAGFSLKIMATNWGFRGTTDEFCAKAKKEGYDGIEMWWPGDKAGQDDLFSALKKHQLEVGFLCGGSSSNPTDHLAEFKKAIDAAANNTVQKPLYINCHAGRDYFTFEQNQLFIDHTTQLSKKTGIIIMHETHRSRILFAASVARQYIDKIPDLRLTLDISHWCTVHESLLGDQPENVARALDRTDHIHARVGHPEGPQVSDPRAPEWEGAVKAHIAWWDTIVEKKKKAGLPLTILTEFGPPDYMPTLPYTRQPLADQWAINVHMMQLLRKRYS